MNLPMAASGGESASASASASASVAALEWCGLMDFPIHDDDDDPLLLLPPWYASPPPPPQPPPQQAAALPLLPPATSRARKRDPRILCSNYSSGRVPCTCPDTAAAVAVEKGGRKKRVRRAVEHVRCQVTGCGVDITELKGYHRRHRVCLRCAYSPAVVIDGEYKRYCQQCGKFHLLPDFDDGKRSCRRKLERHNNRRRRRHNDLITMVGNDGQPHNKDIPTDVIRMLKPTKELLNGFGRDSVENRVIENETLSECEEGYHSPFSSINSLNSKCVTSFTATDEAYIVDKVDNSKTMVSSTFCDKKITYTSECPTGRISFKLYDWNPAEFPRELRNQILQWLASMPVELEGYIRPGCTILTVFIAMPQHMWDKLSRDAACYVKELIYAHGSLLTGRGNIHINLNNIMLQILEDGTSMTNIKMEVQVPRLHYVYPNFFESGKPVEFIVCGRNLNKSNCRFLVSFAGKYLELDSCHAISLVKTTVPNGNGLDSICEDEHEMFRLSMLQTDAKDFGPAFIEVENELGISNFIPVLFGNKNACSKMERMYGASCETLSVNKISLQATNNQAVRGFCEAFVSKQAAMSDLLLDIAWLLKEPQLEEKVLFSSLNIQRFTSLLKYLVEKKSFCFPQEIIRNLDASQIAESDPPDASLKSLLHCINQARETILVQSTNDVSSGLHSADKTSRPHLQENYARNGSDNMTPCMIQDAEGSNQECSGLATTLDSEEQDEISPLMGTERNIQRRTCEPFMDVPWAHKPWSNTFSSKMVSTKSAIVAVVSVLLCYVACIVLVHPHSVGDMVISLKRRLFSGS
ncbi:squamosa promoter-binding-like protein 9 [Typha angustifolia]|uniref:squamosa promoter-binding-like protein 9 n=1 Tax=Typha angustifolia TaxID=59011 RepID=UPI003C2F1E53